MKNLLSLYEVSKLMGDILGTEEARYHFGRNVFTEKEVKKLSQETFPEEVIEKHKNTHVLVAVPKALSILDLERKKSELFDTDSKYFQHRQTGMFTKCRKRTAWYFIRKSPMPNSWKKRWRQQKKSFSDNEYVPDARAMIYTAMIYFLENNVRLFEDGFYRTGSICSSPVSRAVINFTQRGILLLCWNNFIAVEGLGCAEALKLK